MNEKSGKENTELTVEELEFIYGCFAGNLSDSEVLEKMQDGQFPPRNSDFIKQRRKEFTAAKKVLEPRIKAENDPVLAEAKRNHINDLIGVAEIMISGLDGVEFKGEDNYETSKGVSLTRVELVDNLIKNNRKAKEECRAYSHYQNFIIHFSAKEPENEGIEDFAQRHPIALINLLRLVIQKKDFGTGICPVCKAWK